MRKKLKVCLMIFFVALSFPLWGMGKTDRSAVLINLDAQPLYARLGFDKENLTVDPREYPLGWQVFPAKETGRDVLLGEVNFRGKEPLKSFDFGPPDYKEFSFVIPFDLSTEDWFYLHSFEDISRLPAFYFASIGDNWEVWLNGKLLSREMHLKEDGTLALHRNRRRATIPFDVEALNLGTNILTLRLIGDIKHPHNGLPYKGPHYLGDFSAIQKKESELFQLIFIGLYIFVGLYHLFIYSRRVKDVYNLFYGLFSIALGFYLYTRTSVVFFADTNYATRFEHSSLYLVIPFLGAFLEHLYRARLSIVVKIYAVLSFIFIVFAQAFSMNVAHFSLRVWQVLALVMALYVLFWLIIREHIRATISAHRKTKKEDRKYPFLLLLIVRLFSSTQGNILVGSILLFLTAIYDILNSMLWHFSLSLTPYGFLVFTLGTAFVLANRFDFLYTRVSELNTSLDDRLEELMLATEKLTASERKYRSLFEGSSEPVALVDSNLRFIEGNPAAKDFFGLERPGNENITLKDTLYIDEREGNRPVRTLELAASSLTSRYPSREDLFRFRTPLGESKPCIVRFERIQSGDNQELLLRLRPDPETLLMRAFVEGRESWRIENSLASADEVSRHIGDHLKRYLKEDEANYTMICLREMIINAIEHGNLEVGYEDKTKAQIEGRYFEFINERQAMPKYKGRRVLVEYSISQERATFRITDDGKGFDHKKLVKAGLEGSPELLEHGRGLFMTLSAFDRVVYNDKGNQVTLVKEFVR